MVVIMVINSESMVINGGYEHVLCENQRAVGHQLRATNKNNLKQQKHAWRGRFCLLSLFFIYYYFPFFSYFIFISFFLVFLIFPYVFCVFFWYCSCVGSLFKCFLMFSDFFWLFHLRRPSPNSHLPTSSWLTLANSELMVITLWLFSIAMEAMTHIIYRWCTY